MTTSFATTTTAPAARRALHSHRTYRELGYVCTSLVTAITGFTWVVVLFALGAGTLVTVLGLPVLALLLSGARALGRLELDRVHRQLGLPLAAPAPVAIPAGAGFWGRVGARLRDGAGWRAAAYQLLMFPWRVFSFCVAVSLWTTGLSLATLPAWNWVFPTYVGWPGYRLFDYTDAHHVHHAYYIASFWQVTRASLVGIGLLFLAAWATHLLTNVSRGAARALLADWRS
ncbi:sensor domain-containing protein [Kitasatospora sp. RB6PN24]|uniref:sensor domain-containing protein n=1 Tax=Kitasatospora humi TaxID=2893891 RepID=UPI001E5D74DB|nr:sensor domain-containing protein [Kitasatospora humi]MCC9309068.1 sensor domain-containing protein [Kitasatospora humi]